TQREEELLHSQPIESLPQRHRMIDLHVRSQRRFELTPVGLEHRGALVGEEVPVLGVHHDRYAAATSQGNHLAYHRRYEHTLVVVLEDHRIRARDRLPRGVQEAFTVLTSKVAVLLLVEPHELLRA